MYRLHEGRMKKEKVRVTGKEKWDCCYLESQRLYWHPFWNQVKNSKVFFCVLCPIEGRLSAAVTCGTMVTQTGCGAQPKESYYISCMNWFFVVLISTHNTHEQCSCLAHRCRQKILSLSSGDRCCCDKRRDGERWEKITNSNRNQKNKHPSWFINVEQLQENK